MVYYCYSINLQTTTNNNSPLTTEKVYYLTSCVLSRTDRIAHLFKLWESLTGEQLEMPTPPKKNSSP